MNGIKYTFQRNFVGHWRRFHKWYICIILIFLYYYILFLLTLNILFITLFKQKNNEINISQSIAVKNIEAVPAVEKMQIPLSEGVEKPISPKINKLVNEISALNLIEVSELSDLLKKRLNLPDAPVMPMGGFVAAAKEDVEDESPKVTKTTFTVKLIKFDDTKKVALIKEIKSLLPDTNLVQAKKFVESAPNVVKTDVSKEEAESMKEALSKVGAIIEIE